MKLLLKSTLLLSFSAFLASCATSPAPSPSGLGRDEMGHRSGPKGFRTIVIDAGHGGRDSGAISAHTGQKEKDLTLDMAKRLQANLKNDFKVIMMRTDDTFVDLDERVLRANRYGGILVSIHFNSGPSHIRGPETYYWRVDSHGLATRSQWAMAQVSPSESGNRDLVRRRMRLTRNPQIPCVLLEGGYLSNPAESRLIADSSYRQKLVNALATAIRTQAAIGDQGTGPLPKPINAPPSRPTDAPE